MDLVLKNEDMSTAIFKTQKLPSELMYCVLPLIGLFK